jgi:hypothetical protein
VPPIVLAVTPAVAGEASGDAVAPASLRTPEPVAKTEDSRGKS